MIGEKPKKKKILLSAKSPRTCKRRVQDHRKTLLMNWKAPGIDSIQAELTKRRYHHSLRGTSDPFAKNIPKDWSQGKASNKRVTSAIVTTDEA